MDGCLLSEWQINSTAGVNTLSHRVSPRLNPSTFDDASTSNEGKYNDEIHSLLKTPVCQPTSRLYLVNF